ncbi:hypothetical protein CF77_gp36 [Oenococcus phage phi9805]|uniref:Uncharacterized protein n=1 Tax=Oenococcus phage phi9805 TaxID=1435411 RepID=V9QJ89_9CAUD|nr:hypothetical protein [Oenococcus oeni]YP_009005175.1 hypothetical protein CF77_gp36 [Oenococcus phage phi9805]AHC30329.1 hypothetical protein [Oenococcus phage phi9805]KGH60299.1 hypothetical protein X288_02325 [Oenococcus oeni IOEB_9805]KGH75556.1 hypothetical protein X287_04450 [Oenococcus oeni IOEB_9803]KGH78842.1 hypothetical protein X284_01945 [Oenococcus oeni IOEB_8417]
MANTQKSKTPENIIKNNEKFFKSLSKDERNYRQAKYRTNSFIKQHATIEDLKKIQKLAADRLSELENN